MTKGEHCACVSAERCAQRCAGGVSLQATAHAYVQNLALFGRARAQNGPNPTGTECKKGGTASIQNLRERERERERERLEVTAPESGSDSQREKERMKDKHDRIMQRAKIKDVTDASREKQGEN